MKDLHINICNHWNKRSSTKAIERELSRRGAAPARPGIRDLAAADQLHVGGLESIIAFAEWVGVRAGDRVLDVGSGLGGPARYLAAERGAAVTAVELSPELDATARELTARTGLADRVRHACADFSAFAAEERFDLAWLEHVDMHVPEKRRLYGRCRTALADGGRIVWHDWLAGPGGAPVWPLFWSADGAISFLSDEARFAADLAAEGLALSRFAPILERTLGWLEASRRALAGALAKAVAADDAARATRLRSLRLETENAIASVEGRRLVPFFAEAALAPGTERR